MLELIAILTLFGSLIGIILIFYRKIPVLIKFSKVSKIEIDKKHFLINFLNEFKEKIKKRIFNLVFYEIFFQKILSKIRILILKIENKITNWLQKLRKRAKERKIKEDEKDNYWEEIKNNLK